MSSYTLSFKNSVEKDCRKIPKDLLLNIFEHVENLSVNPLPHDAIKLAGAESLYPESGWRDTGSFTWCCTNPAK